MPIPDTLPRKITADFRAEKKYGGRKNFCDALTVSCMGAAANFDDIIKFGDHRQIRRYQMFKKFAFEFGCDVIFMCHPITWSLGSKLRY